MAFPHSAAASRVLLLTIPTSPPLWSGSRLSRPTDSGRPRGARNHGRLQLYFEPPKKKEKKKANEKKRVELFRHKRTDSHAEPVDLLTLFPHIFLFLRHRAILSDLTAFALPLFICSCFLYFVFFTLLFFLFLVGIMRG